MVWHPTSPDGTKSVKANKTILQDNTTYSETNLTKDHFWNVGANEDGHHRFVQAPKYTVGGNPADPVLSAGMDSEYYAKQKTAIECPSHQDVISFIRNSNSIMEIFGIRAMAVFDAAGGILYKHNCTLARNSAGRYTATFSVALPSANYGFLGGGIANSSDTNAVISCEVEANTVLAAVKSTTAVVFRTIKTTGSSSITRTTEDPLQAWFVVFGG